MPYYLNNTTNQLYWLDLEDHEHALPDGCTAITNEQAQAIHDANDAARADVVATYPQPTAFAESVKDALGGIVGISNLPSAALFFAAVQTQTWVDTMALIQDAKNKSVISADQYAAIKAAATTFNIPITL